MEITSSLHKTLVPIILTLSCLTSMSFANTKLDQTGRKNYDGYQLLQISNNSGLHVFGVQGIALQQLYNSHLVTFLSPPSLSSPTEVLLSPEQVTDVKNVLSELNIPFEVKAVNYGSNIQSHLRQNDEQLKAAKGTMNWKAYQTFETIQTWMDSMAKKYPKLVSIETFGKSSEGRAMRAMKISTGDDSTKPAVWLDSGIHAREWISPATVTYMANEIIKALSSNAPDSLLSSVEWIIMPNLNPGMQIHGHLRTYRTYGHRQCLWH